MNDEKVRTAVISTDFGFRDLVRDLLSTPDLGTGLGLEVDARFAEIGEDQVRAVRDARPEILIVDLEDDPDLGTKFVQFLTETSAPHRTIAVGPVLSPELLLSGMRAGVSDYLQKPVTAGAMHAALGRALQHLGRLDAKAKKPGQVFAFFSSKGGSGSTTVCANVALVLQRLTGKRTLLVDLDLELGEIALLLGVQPRFNFVDMVQNFHRMDADLLASYIEQHESGIHLLSAPYHPERAAMVSAEEIRRILHFLRHHYDYIVVDTPKSYTPPTLAVFDQADVVFLVTTVDLPSLRNIQRGLPLLKRVLPRGEEQLRLIVNRYNPRNEISLEDVERTLGLRLFGRLHNDYEAVIHSLNTGKPIVLDSKSTYAKDIRALGAEIAGVGHASGRGKGMMPMRNVMGRLFGRVRGGNDRRGGKENNR